jgi:hypothetical protein
MFYRPRALFGCLFIPPSLPSSVLSISDKMIRTRRYAQAYGGEGRGGGDTLVFAGASSKLALESERTRKGYRAQRRGGLG